ncbi:MAG: hypothetical protein ACI8RZ_005023 [Myxococcota bacterium]
MQPVGYIASDEVDCYDSAVSVYPGAVEICEDGFLNDCNAVLEDGFDACGIWGTIDLADSDVRLIGSVINGNAGTHISSAGDIDGDGLDDVLISSFYGGTTCLVQGGSSGTRSLDTAHATLKLEAYGNTVSDAGDIDGDGSDDFLIGSSGVDDGGQDAGAVYLMLGNVSGTTELSGVSNKLLGERAGDVAGSSVSGPGDVDGDGINDILVGAPYSTSGGNYTGAAYLMRGGLSGTQGLSTAHATFIGEVTNGLAGHTVSGAGDTNGDGHRRCPHQRTLQRRWRGICRSRVSDSVSCQLSTEAATISCGMCYG